MAIVLIQQLSASVSICIWQIIETEAFFMENYQLNTADLLEIQNIKLESRRLESIGSCGVPSIWNYNSQQRRE